MNSKILLFIIFQLIIIKSVRSHNSLNIFHENVKTNECNEFINSVNNLNNLYEKLRHSDKTLMCHLQIKTTIDKQYNRLSLIINDTVDEMLINYLTETNNIRSIIQNIQKEKFQQTNELIECVMAIRNGDFFLALEEYSKLYKNQFNQLIHSVYRHNETYGFKLIEFLNLLSNKDEKINGYKLLLNEMIDANLMNSSLTMTIGYRSINNFPKTNDTLKIIESLPNSVKNFQWNKKILIMNPIKLSNEYHQIIGYDENGEDYQDQTLTTNVLNKYFETHWIISSITNGRYFQIKNVDNGNFLSIKINEHSPVYNDQMTIIEMTGNHLGYYNKWEFIPVIKTHTYLIKNAELESYLCESDSESDVDYNQFKVCDNGHNYDHWIIITPFNEE